MDFLLLQDNFIVSVIDTSSYCTIFVFFCIPTFQETFYNCKRNVELFLFLFLFIIKAIGRLSLRICGFNQILISNRLFE